MVDIQDTQNKKGNILGVNNSKPQTQKRLATTDS